ncbi:hypothetical protein HIM_01897 [Hirsutella minnesotensis 3608]|nr:hypothetical protein HIM_01897 [Hirsutella minnesotensis 3608]
MRVSAVFAACLAIPALAQVDFESTDVAGTIMNTIQAETQTAATQPTANTQSVLTGNTTVFTMTVPTAVPLSTGASGFPVPSANTTLLATTSRAGLPFQPTSVGTNSAPASSPTSGAVGSVVANNWLGLAVAAGLAALQL